MKDIIFSVVALALFSMSSVSRAQDEAPAPSLHILGETVMVPKEPQGCSKIKIRMDEIKKYLHQYDIGVEKDFFSMAYVFSPMDDDGYPSGKLIKNWKKLALDSVVDNGFGDAGNNDVSAIKWMNFSGKGKCDFSSWQSDVGNGSHGMGPSVGRFFLFREIANKDFQLVISQAEDQGAAYGQAFSQLVVSGETYPVVVFSGAKKEYFQWNKSIKGFNVCPKTSDLDEMPAFKIYTKTAIAPKDSFLGKLCASPEARARLVRFLGEAN